LRQRNAANDAWIVVGLLNQSTNTFNLPVAQGGTGAADAGGARTNLGALASTDPSYTGTLTGGTGVINIGSGQLYKDASGNVLVNGTTAASNVQVFGSNLTPRLQAFTLGGGGGGLFLLNTHDSNPGLGGNIVIARRTEAGLVGNGLETGRLVFGGNDGTNIIPSALITSNVDAASGTSDMPGRLGFFTTPDGSATPVERVRIDSNGQKSSVITGGTALLPVFDCRAFVSFNGANGSIRGSGNISSVTRNGTGDYTVNFLTAMPDANYALGHMATGGTNQGTSVSFRDTPPTTSSFRVSVVQVSVTAGANTANDVDYVTLSVFR
jgi:hypothetical protein